MKIGENKENKENKKIIESSNKNQITVLSLLLLLFFLLGALFQERGLSSYLSQFIFEIQGALRNEFNLVNSNGLPTVYIDIPFKSMDAIQQKRSEALSIGVLISSDDDFVPAKLHINQETEKSVELRLKGDWTDHLDTDKWSYRIHVKNGLKVFGTKHFSLQAPETRNFVAEWAFHQQCIQEGILTTKYTFVNVIENGVYKGIYAFEEGFSEELLADQEQREGVILKLDESIFWAKQASLSKQNHLAVNQNNHFDVMDSLTSTDVEVFRPTYLENNPLLNDQKDYAVNLLQAYLNHEISVNATFDVNKMGKYYALVDFWAANHAAHWINIRFYFNPVTGLLEPIAYDGIPLFELSNTDQLGLSFQELPMFDEPQVRAIYLQEMQRLTKKEQFGSFKFSVLEDFNQFQKAIKSEYYKLESMWDKLESRRLMLAGLVNPTYPVRGTYSFNSTENSNKLKIQIKNLTIFPVEIISINVNEKVFPFENSMVQYNDLKNIIYLNQIPFMNFNQDSLQLKLPELNLELLIPDFEILPTPTVTVNVRLYEDLSSQNILLGNNKDVSISLSNYPQQDPPSLVEVLEDFPFIFETIDGNLSVPEGLWSIENDLVLPENTSLNLMPGAKLEFGKGYILLIRGGSLNLLGNEEKNVSISGKDDTWGGVLVINSAQESHWQYADISDMEGFNRNGWMVTGGITFYQSDVTIRNSIISHSLSEDAINIIHSNFLFSNLSIVDTASDAYDGDFSEGTIQNSYFKDIVGDAVDISGSDLNISDSTFIDIQDKAISAGEQSTIHAENVSISSSNIGVASKDLSTVYINNSKILFPTYYALAAYEKKNMYGPGSIEASNLFIDGKDKTALVQSGSSIMLNGELIKSQELDVKTLYDLGILGN